MLEFAKEYCAAIDALTSDRAMDLMRLELDDNEWVIVTQLCDVLKVRHSVTSHRAPVEQ